MWTKIIILYLTLSIIISQIYFTSYTHLTLCIVEINAIWLISPKWHHFFPILTAMDININVVLNGVMLRLWYTCPLRVRTSTALTVKETPLCCWPRTAGHGGLCLCYSQKVSYSIISHHTVCIAHAICTNEICVCTLRMFKSFFF